MSVCSCIHCGCPVEIHNIFCDFCKKFALKNSRYCKRCGSFILFETKDRECSFCIDKNIFFDNVFTVYLYSGIIPSIINRMKYGKNYDLAILLGKHLSFFLPDFFKKSDLIIYPPMTFKDRFRRSFNQAAVFSEIISRRHGINIAGKAIEKTRNTKPQASLTGEERARNLQNAFAVKKNISGTDILLIDDVATTLTTVNSISKILKENGAESVKVATLARTTEYFM